MTFRVGQKVVCVDAKKRFLIGGMGTLTKGRIYTVRWVGEYRGNICIRVEEIHRPSGDDREDFDTPYQTIRFRPIVERKTDISFAHEILRKVSRKDRVLA